MVSIKYIVFTHIANVPRKFENTAFVAEIISYDNVQYSND